MSFKEYFLGTNTHNLYKNARLKNPEHNFRYNFMEFLDLSSSKGLPNLMGVGSLAIGYELGEPLIPLFLIPVGEFFRYCYSKSYQNLRIASGIEKKL